MIIELLWSLSVNFSFLVLSFLGRYLSLYTFIGLHSYIFARHKKCPCSNTSNHIHKRRYLLDSGTTPGPKRFLHVSSVLISTPFVLGRVLSSIFRSTDNGLARHMGFLCLHPLHTMFILDIHCLVIVARPYAWEFYPEDCRHLLWPHHHWQVDIWHAVIDCRSNYWFNGIFLLNPN